ncbi:hypothetical protein DBR40_26580 [Pedobacter sp. KBW01]|uniref:PKD domain-containing protein n=1 Tax=Pedobacter sp. KBW01 TaxID=2153364 RepID=UPI000F59539E|nr:PKD domain-containing protein [Pedobacter sp. KBW01]RQO63983.1 hypothetical protein DBR40_26580 [Pedobacter sp. KBW01]
MFKRFLLFAALSIAGLNLSAQKSFVSVNHFTGTANFAVPLYNVQSGQCALPVELIYSTNGVKSLDLGAGAGRDWFLNAGGDIKRDLRGLPDDAQADLNGNTRLGWLYNNKGALINSFTIANDNNSSTCTDEASDLSYISSNFSDLNDTEPDIFYVNVPGLSCKLVFDGNHQIKTIPYKDLRVTYGTDINGAITSFTIINDKGLRYTFGDLEKSKKVTKGTLSNIKYFKNEYDQYRYGINFNSCWKLTKMTDPNGNVILLDYDQLDNVDLLKRTVTSVDSVNFNVGAPSNTFARLFQFTKTTTFVPRRLIAISYGHDLNVNLAITFDHTSYDYKVPLINSITGYGKKLLFNYTFGQLISSISWENSKRGYYFKYNKKTPDPTYLVPDSSNRQMDYWGYYNKASVADLNPKVYINAATAGYERYRNINPGAAAAYYGYTLPGAERVPNASAINNATLKEIGYPEGGSTTLTFEPNDYYDNTAGAVLQGSGVRIKQVVDYDGINTGNNVVKDFSYINPTTGQSSGKAISLPAFAFATPYTGGGSAQDQWNYSTVRSEYNLAEENNTVVYGYVRESQSGKGSTLYEFTSPATNWEIGTAVDWNPTVVNIARPDCNNYGFVENAVNTYPFPPNINYDFERGLIKKATNFNSSGNQVSEVAYSYIRTGTPVVVTGFKSEDNAGVKAYAKYNIYTSVSELTSQETSKTFDSSNLGTSQQMSTNIYYNSPLHKLPTLVEKVNSDGSINRNYTTYSKDIASVASSDPNVIALDSLKNLNINIPVETYTKLERNSINKTVGADLAKFGIFNPTGSKNLFLPSQTLQFTSIDGVTDFSPMSVASGSLAKDSRYVASRNSNAYDFSAFLLDYDDNNRNQATVLTDHISMQPVLTMANSGTSEIGFNDFNSETANCKFIKDNSSYTYTTNSRTGKSALTLPANESLSLNLKKNTNAGSYIFSIWVNTTSAGNITLQLTNTASQVSSYNLGITNSSGKWKYYELKVPVTNMSATFQAKFQSNIAAVIDDVLFYPEQAEVSTFAYDPVTFQKTARTSTNGVSEYYTYDGLGRIKYVLDQDQQIVLKDTYIAATYNADSVKISSVFKANFTSANQSNINGSSFVNFTAQNRSEINTEGIKYTWDFGDGTTTVTTTNAIQYHAFTRAGTYNVKLTASSPYYSTKDTTIAVTVKATLPIIYTQNTTTGHVTSLQLYQGGIMVYNFSESDLMAGQTIWQGDYSVKVYYSKSGPATKSIKFKPSDFAEAFCFSTTVASPLSFNADLKGSASLNLIVDTAVCLL